MPEIAEERSSWFSRFTFLALVTSLGFIQVPITLFGQSVVVTDLVFLCVAAAWLFDVARRRHRPIWHPFYWLLLFYLASLTLSCLFSTDPRQSFLHLPSETYLLALAFLTADVTRNSAGLKSALIAWLLGAAFAVLAGVVTIALFYAQPSSPLLDDLTYHYGAVPVGNYPRITATFVSASMFCDYLNVSLILTMLAAAAGWISHRLALALGLLVFICSVFTISVGLGGMFLGLGLIFYFLSYPMSRLRSIAVLAAGLAALVFLILSTVSLVPLAGLTFAPSGRIMVWRDAFRTFTENPLTGHGLGLPVANVVFKNSEGGYSLLTDAHNTYLSVAAQAGVFGLVAIVAITVYFLYKWKDAIRDRRNHVLIGLGVAFLCAFVYQGLTGSFEHARHLWVLMGLFIAAERIETDQNS